MEQFSTSPFQTEGTEMNSEKSAVILLIEDNPNDAELTLRALRENNLANEIKLLDDGEKALNYIFCRGEFSGRDQSENPKLIILDLKLPKVDGLEILRELKSSDATKSIPVVVLTSSQHETDVITSYKLGVNSYIVKPVEFDKFVDAVRQLGLYWMLINQQPMV